MEQKIRDPSDQLGALATWLACGRIELSRIKPIDDYA